MPRASKSKSDPSNPRRVKSSVTDSVRPVSKSAISKNVASLDKLFGSYENKSFGWIDPEGIETLCSDIGVAHTDVKILMLAWKMKAAKQGFFTREEWQRGLTALQVNTITKLKKALPKLEKEAREPVNLGDFYSFAFRYCLTEDNQKCLDIESVCVLLELVLGSHFQPQVDSFSEYLKIQNDYKVINMDQWVNFFRFCNEISFPDLQDYDTNQAWPLVLDNFVEWMRKKQRELGEMTRDSSDHVAD